MAPQIGPNEAPMMLNTAGRLAANGTSLPVASGTGIMARRMLTRAPRPTERAELTCGMTVLKLLAAMNDEKQAPGKADSGSPIMIAANRVGSRRFSKALVTVNPAASEP